MCIICIEFSKTRDLFDAKRMLAHARKEPQAVAIEHLDRLGEALDQDLDLALADVQKIADDSSTKSFKKP